MPVSSSDTVFLIFLIFFLFAWLPVSVAKFKSFGWRYLVSNRSKEPAELSKWGARCQRAHNNLKDYAPVFIASYLLARYLSFDAKTLTTITWVYLISRILHYLFYGMGQVNLRAISWTVSMAANMYLIIKLI